MCPTNQGIVGWLVLRQRVANRGGGQRSLKFGLTWAGDVPVESQSRSCDVFDQSEALEVRDDAWRIRGSKELVILRAMPTREPRMLVM